MDVKQSTSTNRPGIRAARMAHGKAAIAVKRTQNRAGSSAYARRRSRLVVGTAIISACAAVTGCGVSSHGAGGNGKNTFVLGIEAPLTGGDAASGKQMLAGATLALKDHGMKVGKYTIKPVAINSTDDPASGATAVEQAINSSKVQALTGIWDNDVAIAQVPIIAKAKIPMIFSGAAANTIAKQVTSNLQTNRYWDGFAFPPNSAIGLETAEAVESFYKSKPTAFTCGKTVAFLGEQSDFGTAVVGAAQTTLTADGWKTTNKTFFPINQASNASPIQTAIHDCSSVILSVGTATSAMTGIVNQSRQLKYKGVLAAIGLGYTANYYSLTGKNSNGVLDVGTTLRQTPKAAAFAKAFKKTTGSEPAASAGGTYYDYTNFLIKCMQAAIKDYGSLTSDTLQKVLFNDVRTGKLTAGPGVVYKGIRFSPSSWPAPVFAENSAFRQVIQYQDGKANVVWPLDESTAKWIAP